MSYPRTSATIRILESYGEPRPTTNPYIAQLTNALRREPGCQLLTFSFKRGIFGSYDVFHVHWPEVIYSGSTGMKGAARELLFAMILGRIQLQGTAVVRTRHNIQPHAGSTRRQRWLESWVNRLTTATIRLNDTTECPPGKQVATIPHGHYQEWFADYPVQPEILGRIGYFGLIKQYKGVESLLAAFMETTMPGLSLSITGKPASTGVGEHLRSMAGADSRVDFDFRYLSDGELVGAVTAAELIVLPYQFMHNSGAALAALSLNRPVLVPDTVVNRRLSAEVGHGWVHLFAGTVDASVIETAVHSYRSSPPLAAPDLSGRTWRTTGRDHLRFFENVLLQQQSQSVAAQRNYTVPSDVG